MAFFGPVSEAAHGGHSSPMFDFVVGAAVLLAAWGYYFRNGRPRKLLGSLIGVTGIALVFVAAGIYELR